MLLCNHHCYLESSPCSTGLGLHREHHLASAFTSWACGDWGWCPSGTWSWRKSGSCDMTATHRRFSGQGLELEPRLETSMAPSHAQKKVRWPADPTIFPLSHMQNSWKLGSVLLERYLTFLFLIRRSLLMKLSISRVVSILALWDHPLDSWLPAQSSAGWQASPSHTIS